MANKTPDKPEKIVPYEFDELFQRYIARLAISRPKFWARIGREVDPQALTDPLASRVFALGRVIEAATGQGPGSPLVMLQTVKRLQHEGKVTAADVEPVRELVIDALDSPVDINTGIAEEQVAKQIQEVLRTRMRKVAVDEAIKAYGAQKDDLSNVMKLFQKAERVGAVDITTGTTVGSAAILNIQAIRNVKRLATGIPDLDGILTGGVPAGTFNLFLAGTGDGKSMALGHVFAKALVDKMPAAYATLELSVELVLARVVANLTCIPSEEIMTIDEAYEAAEARLHHLEDHRCFGFGALKYFTPRVATVDDLESWIDSENEAQGVEIRLLCVDYAALLAEPTKKARHEEIERIAERLRSIAISRNMWVWTGGQLKAEGLDKRKTKKVGNEHAAGALAIVNTADTVVGISRDDEDMMRMNVSKARGGKSKVEVGPFPSDFEFGRISPIEPRSDWPEW